MLRLSLLTAYCLLFFSSRSHAQDTIPDYAPPPKAEKPKMSQRDRFYFGGSLGLTFGTVTYIAVEPFMGYKLTNNGKLSVGTGISYQYYKDNRYVPSYESNSYGYKFFTRYRVIEPLFLHVEYQQMNYEFFNPYDGTSYRRWVPFLLVGGGYSQRVGGNAYFMIQALWDVIADPYSPYDPSAPWISIGVGVGF